MGRLTNLAVKISLVMTIMISDDEIDGGGDC